VWALRRDWPRQKEQIKNELLSGNYRFSLLTRITLTDYESMWGDGGIRVVIIESLIGKAEGVERRASADRVLVMSTMETWAARNNRWVLRDTAHKLSGTSLRKFLAIPSGRPSPTPINRRGRYGSNRDRTDAMRVVDSDRSCALGLRGISCSNPNKHRRSQHAEHP
jgi:hypothetical protein